MLLKPFKYTVYGGICIALLMLFSQPCYSVPSYARQTNLSCNSCHTIYPELKAFGRSFKLNAYTLSSADMIESKDDNGRTDLQIDKIPPLSAMLQTSFTNINKKQPGTQNNNIEFPQQLSFFFAGKITPSVGSFMQITYDDQSAAFGWDNVDIRFAKNGTLGSKPIIYGLTLNNNPTVQDIWNTTPAWGFPYAASAVVPTPAAAALIDGGLAQEVAGVGAYTLWNNLIFGGFSVYRSAPQGGPFPPDITASGIVKGIAPYWRFALQRQGLNSYIELGTFGLVTKQYPQGVSGMTNQYTDIGFDLQYERTIGTGIFTTHFSYVMENQDLDETYLVGNSANKTDKLDVLKLDGNYYFRQRCGISLGYFSTVGDSDPVLYSPSEITGSLTGKPDSNGLIGELSYIPWLNTRFSIQYVLYNKFNGASKNYDGFGRNAADNQSLFLLAWMAF